MKLIGGNVSTDFVATSVDSVILGFVQNDHYWSNWTDLQCQGRITLTDSKHSTEYNRKQPNMVSDQHKHEYSTNR